ncbi:MAG: ATPase domain-containing protein [Pirellulales bacterium]
MPSSEIYAGSGISGLDEVLGGGFPRGHTYLIHGASGAGKTTLSLQYLIEGARNGENVLYLGTSETEHEIRRIADSHGWSLDGVTLHHHVPPPPGGEQTVLHPADMELPQTIETMLSVAEEVKPSRLVIDSLTEIRVLSQNELWYRRQLMTLKHHFADSRCTVLLLDIPSNQSTLNSIVSGVIELEQTVPLYGPDRRRLRVVKIRGQEFSTGHHDYKICRGGIEAFPRLVAAKHRRRHVEERAGTGLPALDALLKGGLMRGNSTLLLGTSGTAKSLMASHLVVAAAQRGEKSVMYVFDERVQTLFQRSHGVGLPLERYVEEGLIEVRQIDPTEWTTGEFSSAVKRSVEQDGIRMMVIDSLNGYAYAMPDERLLSLHLHELFSYLSQQAVTPVFTMTQHGVVPSSIQQPFDVSYIADTVMLFRHFEFRGEVRKAISVYKMRSGPHEATIRELQIGPDGIRVGEPLRQFHGILTGTPHYTGDVLDGNQPAAEP